MYDHSISLKNVLDESWHPFWNLQFLMARLTIPLSWFGVISSQRKVYSSPTNPRPSKKSEIPEPRSLKEKSKHAWEHIRLLTLLRAAPNLKANVALKKTRHIPFQNLARDRSFRETVAPPVAERPGRRSYPGACAQSPPLPDGSGHQAECLRLGYS